MFCLTNSVINIVTPPAIFQAGRVIVDDSSLIELVQDCQLKLECIRERQLQFRTTQCPTTVLKDLPTVESAAKGQPAPEISVSTSQPIQVASASVAFHDRAELLARARSFLTSPQVRLQDSDAKRIFLEEKGLTPNEVDQLLRELPPSVPPRTYPPPPPSNLPNLLVGIVRIFTWLTSTSAIVLFIYYRYLLPKLAQSYQARLALRQHHSALVARLTKSASALRTTQVESYKDLPRTVPVYEDSQYAQCHTIDDILSHVGSSGEEPTQPGADIPDITILRCALEELSRSKTDGTSTEELFRHLESKFQWLGREDGAARQVWLYFVSCTSSNFQLPKQNDLWNQLNACLLFVSSMPKPGANNPLPLDHPSRLLWKYVPPSLPPPPPLLASLENLQAALPCSQEAVSANSGGPPPASTISARQRMLQVLSDFTGYITTQTYSLGLPSVRGTNGVASGGNPVEDELRREIRALKGLVLNRRSFLPFGAGASGFTSDPTRSS
ncbi:hypothetical protein J3R82DRAFT_4190 [Butyriboletus roseoflavus]|nr:hypothetical protein J3R82DRAFT_4190 [Butyriboletus roseoflavus]